MCMHTQSTRKRLLLSIGVLAAVSADPLLASSDDPTASAPTRVLAVNVLEARSVATYTVAHTDLRRIESARRSQLAFEVPGMVSHIIPEEGDTIETGAVVAVMIDRRDDSATRLSDYSRKNPSYPRATISSHWRRYSPTPLT